MIDKFFFKNRYFRAFIYSIAIYALIHIVALLIYAFFYRKIFILNAFDILDFDLFFPWLKAGAVNFILSYSLVLIIFLAVFFTLTSDKK